MTTTATATDTLDLRLGLGNSYDNNNDHNHGNDHGNGIAAFLAIAGILKISIGHAIGVEAFDERTPEKHLAIRAQQSG